MKESLLKLEFPEFKNNFNEIFENSKKRCGIIERKNLISFVTSVCAVLIIGIISFSVIGYINDNRVYGFSDLKPKVIQGDPVFNPWISVYPQAKHFERLNSEILSYFEEAFCDIPYASIDGYVEQRDSGEVHYIVLSISFEEGSILITIDPNNYPVWVFEENQALTIGDYEVASILTGDHFVNGETVCDIMVVGMKKGDMGIRILSSGTCIDELNKVFDVIVQNKIDFDSKITYLEQDYIKRIQDSIKAYIISGVEPKVEYGINSFYTYISPYPGNGYQEELNDEYLLKFKEALKDTEYKNLSGHFLRYGSGEIHSLFLLVEFDRCTINIVIDPNNYPKTIFNNNNSYIVNDYEVASKLSYDVIINNEPDYCVMMIGLKKGDMGIRIDLYEDLDCIDELNKVFDVIVQNKIDFESLLN